MKFYDQCERSDKRYPNVGCFGIPVNPASSNGISVENKPNCIADRNCLVLASFEYCDTFSTNGSQTSCGRTQYNTQNTGDDPKLRITLQLDTRYINEKRVRFISKANLNLLKDKC